MLPMRELRLSKVVEPELGKGRAGPQVHAFGILIKVKRGGR